LAGGQRHRVHSTLDSVPNPRHLPLEAQLRLSFEEFDAPAFRDKRERWGTPRFGGVGQSAEILRWESLALPRTPLPQDDGGGGGFAVPVCQILVGIPFGAIWFASTQGSFDCVASSLRDEGTALAN
jgi:hypothetical protein